ncbi:MAG: alpha-amylase family glycosyl hydrolase [Candidatus Sumerlaeota bacterium]|nr:alpha-amylase family glycosyl hydrolase [Candidatus Sumerlaeota bacterium]
MSASYLVYAGLALALVCAQGVARAEFELKQGALELKFDEDGGALTRIAYHGQEIARPKPGTPPLTFGVGPTTRTVWFEQMGLTRRLVKQARPSPGVLELTIAAGPYELLERYRLHADQPRLDRSAQITNRGAEILKLRGVAFRTPGIAAGETGFVRFPGVWPPRSWRFAEMESGRKHYGRGTIAPAAAELSPARTLLWMSCTDDQPSIEMTEDRGSFEMRQGVNAAGYLRPNQPQDIGFVTLQIADSDYWSSLERLWDWMDSAGIKVPADRSDWVPEGILYSFHPGGTIGSGFKDLGGFEAATQRLLPTLPRLGVNAAWTLPVEFKSPYWPLDYYRFMDGLGDGAQYRALVAKAHALNLRFWQDLVPHGGAPQAVHNQKHPEFMLRREDGTTLDYWLNDFALPAWQKFIAEVTAHYMKEYGIDGFRVDACGGSKEPNWNPDISYARASLAQLRGGLDMLRGIRDEVRKANPKYGSVLAEVESARHAAFSDAEFDFSFCYTLCPNWNRMEAGPYADALREFLEEQKYVMPRGQIMMRHVESHDALRSQGWYGVRGARAMYALSAWIGGMPMIYQGMEDGHAIALAEINRIRRERPELSRGDALYRAASCDAPGVFTCLRKLGSRESVVAINFNRDPVKAKLSWPEGGAASVELGPLDYAVVDGQGAAGKAGAVRSDASDRSDRSDQSDQSEKGAVRQKTITLDEAVAFERAEEWFVDSIEGRLRDAWVGTRGNGQGGSHSIYWRPQGTGTFWRHATTPLHPLYSRIGVKTSGGAWTVYQIEGESGADLRLAERNGEKPGLWLLGAKGLKARVTEMAQPPAEPDVTRDIELGGVKLRCVGPEYIVSNSHYTIHLRRQGGVIRQWRAGGDVMAQDLDFYGDQEYFASTHGKQVKAMFDVECGARIRAEADGLHLRFEGQLRGDQRFALMRSPMWYRNEYVFNAESRFIQRWAFRTEKEIKNQKAFLAFFLQRALADRFRFEREGKALSEGVLDEGSNRQGLAKDGALPDAAIFTREGKPSWKLTGIQAPAAAGVRCFMQGHKLFMTLLDGAGSSLEANRWYEFQAVWHAPGAEPAK